jgi:hypothetical protein
MGKRIVTGLVVLTLIAIGWGSGVRSYAQEGGDGPPAAGNPVSIIGLDGTEIARITITEVEDPFEDIDPNAAPDRSYRYVLVHLAVENTGSRPFLAASNSVSLQDADGFLYPQTFLPRSEEQIAADPDFPNGEIAPGDTASGVIAFEVLESADLVRVVYQPAFDRLIFLADLTQQGAAPPANEDEDAAATPATDDEEAGESGTADDSAGTEDSDDDAGADTGTDVSGDDEDAAPDDADDPAGDDGDTAAVDVSAGDCDDIQAWLDDVTPQLDLLSETLDDVAADDPITPETLEDAAADLQEAADNLRDSDPPDLMEESADLLAEALDGYAAIYLEAAEEGEEISVEDFFTNLDTSEPDALLDEVGTVSDPVFDACGIDA